MIRVNLNTAGLALGFFFVIPDSVFLQPRLVPMTFYFTTDHNPMLERIMLISNFKS
jgi:hypothetical protein